MSQLSHSCVGCAVEVSLRHVIEVHCQPPWTQDLVACVPQLAALLDACHDQPMDHLLHVIREILLERCQSDEGGDAPLHDNGVLGEVALMLSHEMERLRCQGVHRGQWSSDLAPAPMCG